jgi:putative DNA primase/helicase
MSDTLPGIPLSFDANPTRDLGELVSPRFSEDDIALCFTREHGADWRYVARWGKWFRFDGARWAEDQKLEVFDCSRKICRENSALCDEKDKVTPKRLNTSAFVYAVVRLASSDSHHAATTEQWDADAWALNTASGYINLRTGEVEPNAREKYATKITAGPAGAGRDCPLWRTFLKRVTAEDQELEDYLQRMAGYCLTGSTREHAMFFFYGTGANGKGTFLNTLLGIMGAYAQEASMETFCESKHERHPTELAAMRGARLVVASETPSGRMWAEAKIKTLTGGDTVRARFMHCDEFEFVPQFKLCIMGNHKPGLRGVNEAIRRRLHLIPFTVVIPDHERDLDLGEKLKAEWPAILQWTLDGCREWQRQNLNPPKKVLDATAEYLASEDKLGRWIEERANIDKASATSTKALYRDFCEWLKQAGEHDMSQKRFSQELRDHGFTKDHDRNGSLFYGIELREAVL